jgi:hypothetical protein
LVGNDLQGSPWPPPVERETSAVSQTRAGFAAMANHAQTLQVGSVPKSSRIVSVRLNVIDVDRN